jgi:catechol 2,3-dioxygenase
MNDMSPGIGHNAPGIFTPRRIGHVNFWVNDHEKVADFYRDVVGVEEVYRRPAIKAIFMSNGNTYPDVAFMDLDTPRGAGKNPGLHHFSLELESEKALVDGYRECLKRGYNFDFTISADVTNSAYGSDPDGNRFEVYADITGNWREERKGEVSSGGRQIKLDEIENPRTEHLYPVNPEIRVNKNAVLRPKRVSHAVLVAKNYPAMVRHYTEIAGLHLIAGGPDKNFATLGGLLEEETLSVFRLTGSRKPGLHHYGWEMPGERELDEAKARAAKTGVKSVADIDHETRRSLYLIDPAGLLVQFYVNRKANYRAWETIPDDLALFVA